MADATGRIVLLADMEHGQEGDCFVLMTLKEQLRTREGKPYHRVGFRDAGREVTFPIWCDSPQAEACRDEWTPGECYKIRGIYRETSYGPQLDIQRIRPICAADEADGYDPAMFLPQSEFDAVAMFDELLELARQHVSDEKLLALVERLLVDNREALLRLPAARKNHHAFAGGYLEHVLNVTHNCLWLATRYAERYPQLQPPLSVSLVVAGGILHDIGKLRELECTPAGTNYSVSGVLLGHILQGRDLIREAAVDLEMDPETLLRLEHIIVSHQRLAEWGSPKPPHTPEALIVHHADDLDAKFQMMMQALASDNVDSPLTSNRNPLKLQMYRGGGL